MGNYMKNEKYNYTIKDFIEEFGGKENETGEKIRKTLDYFKIDRGFFHNDKNNNSTRYDIPYEFADLLNCMIKAYELSITKGKKFPKNKKTLKMDEIINYNKKLFDEIEKLPDYIKYDIKKDSSYKYNYKFNELSKILIEKLSVLFSIVMLRSNVEAGNILEELIKNIDILICRYFDDYIFKKYLMDENIMQINLDEDFNINFKNRSKYSLESVLKNAFDDLKIKWEYKSRKTIEKNKLDVIEYDIEYTKNKNIFGFKDYMLNINLKNNNNDLDSEINNIFRDIDKGIINDNKSLYRYISNLDNEYVKRKLHKQFLLYLLSLDENEVISIEKYYKEFKNNIKLLSFRNNYNKEIFIINVLQHFHKEMFLIVDENKYNIEIDENLMNRCKKNFLKNCENNVQKNLIRVFVEYNLEDIFEFSCGYSDMLIKGKGEKDIGRLYKEYIDLLLPKLIELEKEFVNDLNQNGSQVEIERILNNALGEMMFSRLRKEYLENDY